MLDGATMYDSHVYYVFAELALIVGRVTAASGCVQRISLKLVDGAQ